MSVDTATQRPKAMGPIGGAVKSMPWISDAVGYSSVWHGSCGACVKHKALAQQRSKVMEQQAM